jgi:hypothetical protein
LDRPQPPLFRRGEGRIDKGFTQIDLPAVSQVLGEVLEEPVQPPRALPQLESSMAGLVGRIARRQVVPRRASAENPQHTVHHRTWIDPRPPAPVGATAWTERRFKYSPLGVGQIHAIEYDGDPTDVSGDGAHL